MPRARVPPLVLIVEDDVLQRMFASDAIEHGGFQVLEAASADEAIAILEAHNDICIVFTDIQMPGTMDGVRLAYAIRDRWPPIQLVITSGNTAMKPVNIPERCEFVSKPYDVDRVIRRFRQMAA